MAVTQYIGSRYIPLFAEPIEWSSQNTYEPLTIVIHEGNSYTSKQAVPKGIDITNESFWGITGNYNAQIEQYRRDTAQALQAAQAAQQSADDAQSDIDVLLPKSAFSQENTVQQYVDASLVLAEEFTYETLENPSKAYDITHCVDYYGADPTGEESSSAAIAACIEACKGTAIFFSAGTYLIDAPISTYYNEQKRVQIYGNGAIVKPISEIPCMIDLGVLNPSESNTVGAGYEKFVLKDIVLWNEDNRAEVGIKIENNYRSSSILNCNVIGFKKGLIAGDGTNPTDVQIDNCCFRYTDTSDVDSVGLYFRGTDNKVCNSYIVGFHTCINSRSGLFAINVHNLPKWEPRESYLTKLQNSTFFELNGGAVIDNCYCDTYEKFVVIKANGDYKITNNTFYSYMTPFNMTFVDIATASYFQGSISLVNNTFNVRPTPSGNPTNTSVKFGDWSVNRPLKGITIESCYAVGDNTLELRDSLVPWDMFKHANHYRLSYANDQTVPQNSWMPLAAFLCDKNSALGFELEITYLFGTPRAQHLLFSIFNAAGFWNTDDISQLNVNAKNFESSLSPAYEYGYTAIKADNQTILICIYVRNTTGTISTNMQVSVSNEFGAFYVYPWNVPRMGWHTYNTANLNQNAFDLDSVQTLTIS